MDVGHSDAFARSCAAPPSGERDHLSFLAMELMPRYGVLVFCPSKAQCGTIAQWLARHPAPAAKREELLRHPASADWVVLLLKTCYPKFENIETHSKTRFSPGLPLQLGRDPCFSLLHLGSEHADPVRKSPFKKS